MRAALQRERSLLAQILVTVAGAGASRVLLLLAVLLAARALGPDGFGVFALGQTTVLLVGATLTLGQPVTLSRGLARDAGSAPLQVRRAFRRVLVAVGPVLLLSVLLADALAQVVPTALPAVLLPVAALGATAFALGELVTSSYQGLLLARSAAVFQALRALAGCLFLGVALLLTRRPELLLLALAVADLLAVCAGAYRLRLRLTAGAEQPSAPARSTDAALAGRAFTAGLVLQVCLWGSQVLLAQASLAEVGLFAFSYRCVQVLLFAPAAAAPLLLPRLTARTGDRYASDPAKVYAALSAVVVVPAGVVLAALAPWLADLQGAGYEGTVAPLRWLTLLPVVIVGNNVLSQLALARGRDSAWLVSDVVLSVGLLAVAAILVPTHGAVGLALAHVAGYAASCACLLVPVSRRREVRVGTGGSVGPSSGPSRRAQSAAPQGSADAVATAGGHRRARKRKLFT